MVVGVVVEEVVVVQVVVVEVGKECTARGHRFRILSPPPLHIHTDLLAYDALF